MAEAPSLQGLWCSLAPEVVTVLARRHGDFAAAEDAVQEALLAAATQWPRDGVPDNPRGWLLHVATRRLTDEVRAASARRRREAYVVSLVPPEEQVTFYEDVATARDDSLQLLFLCCHPALSDSSAVALTLRAFGGLTTAEIARAFMVPEATMAQRISRAKQTLKEAAVELGPLAPGEQRARLGAVMHVLYLVFSEGYTASAGAALIREDLSREALRLARMLRAMVSDEPSFSPEAAGLLALMLLTDARRAARTDASGALIPIDEQDRRAWDRAAIEEGDAIVTECFRAGHLGPYQIQAAIAAVHDRAESAEATDWEDILGLYGVLLRMEDNPAVALNHAVAFAMVHGPRAGLARVEALSHDERLARGHRLDAVRGHLLERAGDAEAAVAAYQRAAERTASVAERNYLIMRAARLRQSSG